MLYFLGLPAMVAAPLWIVVTKNVALLVAGVIVGIGIGFLIEGVRSNAGD